MNEMISINSLAEITRLSERTIFRLLKDPGFPRVKVGKRLLFKKDVVLDYLTSKYGNV
jgi:excisionase family DNA binding protein